MKRCESCRGKLAGRQRRFCSKRCLGVARGKQYSAECAKRAVYRVCKQCGKIFKVVRNRSTYCSRKCANPNNAQAKAYKRPSLFGEFEACLECGTPVMGGRKDKRYCSARCRREFWNRKNKVKEAKYKRLRPQRHVYVAREYALSAEAYERMMAEQRGVCRICGHVPSGAGRDKHLFVDHSHKSGAVRGLLCAKCNSGLGMFRDDPMLLMSACAYLSGGAVVH